MFYWSDVTRNLIMQNSGQARQHGGDLGTTTWSYVVGNDGNKTIDPALAFYLKPPPNSTCRWSTDHGRLPPNHIVLSDGCSENRMPPRELLDWNDDTVQSKVDQYRDQYWEELKLLVRPNTFEDLYELFDSSTLWQNGAYNLWKLVNALVTLAHDQFPCVLQDWKNLIEGIVHQTFRPVAGSRLVRQNNSNGSNMQILHNQHVLAGWDRVVDPLVLLHLTTFPACDLPLMSVQQHGLLRELLICEHIRLTGTKSPVPPYFNYPRPLVHAAPIPAAYSDIDRLQHGCFQSTVQAEPCRIAMQTTPVSSTVKSLKSAMPLVVVGSDDHDGQLKIPAHDMPTVPKKSVTIQSPGNPLPSPAPLCSIPEESTCTGDQETQCVSATGNASSTSKSELTSHDVSDAASEGLTQDAIPPVIISAEATPTHGQIPEPETTPRHEVPMVQINATEAEAAVPTITSKEASPSSRSPLPGRDDGNGSADDLFSSNLSIQRLQVERKRSVASAPDQDTDSMLTMAEKNALAVTETPPIKQALFDQQPLTLYPASDASVANDLPNQGLQRHPVPRRNEVPPRPEPLKYQTQTLPHYNRPMGLPSPQSSRTMPPSNSSSNLFQGRALLNQSPPNARLDSNGHFTPNPTTNTPGPNPQHGPQLPPGGFIPQDPLMGAAINAQMRPPAAPLSQQMPQHMNQHFNFQGSLTNDSLLFNRQVCVPGAYQANGYIHQPQQYDHPGQQGDGGYSSNGYRINSNDGINSLYNGKRRDSIQSNGSRKNHMQHVPASANSIPRQHSACFPARRLASIAMPDQSRGRPVSSSCQNETGLARDELFTAQFIECSCARCQESSRSVFVRMRYQDNMSEEEIQNAIMEHFGQFKPVNAKVKYMPNITACFVQFRNDLDIAQIVNWSRNPQNQSASGISDRIHTWYPLFSKHYIPEQRGRTQDRHKPHSQNEHNRRDSDPFRNQQPVDTSGVLPGYNGSNSLRNPYSSANFNGSPPAPGFPPSNGIFYQQIHPHNQHRLLYNPKTPQRRESKVQTAKKTAPKTEKKLCTNAGYSQDVRRSRLLPEGPWRHSKVKSASRGAFMEQDDDTTVAITGKSSAPSNEKANISHSVEQDSAYQDGSLDHLGNDSLHGDTEFQGTTEVSNLHKRWPQENRLQNEQQEKPKEKQLQTATSKRDRTRTDDLKIAPGKNNANDATSTVVTTSDTGSPVQRAVTPTNKLESGVKSVTMSHSTKIETAEPVQQEAIPVGGSYIIDGHGHESVVSSRALSPQTASSSEEQIATHHHRSPVGSRKFDEKQTGLAESIETSRTNAASSDKATGSYSMTTSQLSSAVEDLGYSTETIIRHKPGRPSLPLQWAVAEVDDGGRTGAQSSSAGVNLDRFRDVEHRINAFCVQKIARITASEMAEDMVTRGRKDANGAALMTKEATSSSEDSISNNAKTIGESLGNSTTKSAVVKEQNPAPSCNQSKKNKTKKKKSQGERSHLTSRSGTPVDTQSWDASTVPEETLETTAFNDESREDPSSRLRNNRNNEASSECSSQPRRTRKKQAKKGTKRTPLMPEVSDGQAACSGSRVTKKQGDPARSSWRKAEGSQADLAEGSPIQANAVVANLQSLPVDKPEKASNVKLRPVTTGGSLRMPKSRSSKTGGQKSAPHSAAKSKASIVGEIPSLSSMFKPPTEEITGVPSETNAFADQKLIVDEIRKPKSSTSFLKLPKSDNDRVALPRVAVPLPRVAQSTETNGTWASVARKAVICAPKSNKLDDDDPFTVDKEQVELGDFIKAKNLKSPLKAEEDGEKESVSHDKASSTPSSEKNSRHQNATNKTQLNAAVESFNPSASCTSSFPSTRQKLNPNAATFNLASSAMQSAGSAHSPGCDQPGGPASAMEGEQPIAFETRKTAPERNAGRKRHTKKPSFPEPAGSTDRRFITPAEQVLDAMNVVQPPPPSKEAKRAGSIPDSACKTGHGVTLTIDAHQTTGEKLIANKKTTTDNIYATESAKVKDVKEGAETGTNVAGNANAKPQSTAHKTSHEQHSTSNPKKLSTDLFPTLDQAATVGQNKKRGEASIAKAGSPTGLTARVSGTVVRSDIKAASQLMSSDTAQQNGAEANQTIAQRLSGGPAPVAENMQVPRLVQKRTDVQSSELKQDGEEGVWQTVAPKQKNNSGANRGYHGGRTGKSGSGRPARGGRSGRGGRDGAMEERKGG